MGKHQQHIEQTREPQGQVITNIQKIGTLRFYGKPAGTNRVGAMTEVEAGKTGTIPADTWERYKDRADVKAGDGVRFIIGGLKPGQILDTPNAQQLALRVERKDLETERARLEQMKAQLEAQAAELSAKSN